MGNVVASRLQPPQMDFSFYEIACRTDPDVQSFDRTLKDRTNRVLQALAMNAASSDAKALSFVSVKEVTTCLLEMDRDVMEVILAYQEDVWQNEELLLLVREFFDNSLATLEFCTSADASINAAKDSQLILDVAVKLMPADHDPALQEMERVFDLLQSFKEAREPFGEDFIKKFKAVQDRHALMLERLWDKKKRLDRKLRHVKMWAKMSSILFGAAIAAVFICSVVTAVVATPAVAGIVAAVATFPLGSMGTWVRSMWSKYENEIKAQLEVLQSMQVGTIVAIHELENIRHLVNDLEGRLRLITQDIQLAEDHQDLIALRLAIEDIKCRKVDFVNGLDNLQEHIDRVSNRIRQARAIVLQTITKRTRKAKRPGSF